MYLIFHFFIIINDFAYNYTLSTETYYTKS